MEYSVENRLSALPQIAEKKLIDILDKIPGQKDLIIDSNLVRPLEKVVGVSKLRSHGVDKIYKLDKSGHPIVNSQRVYFIKADLITAKYVCDQIRLECSSSQNHKATSATTSCSYHVILVPRKLLSIVKLFEEEGVFGYVSWYAYKPGPLVLDSRLLSDETQDLFKMLFVDGDQAFLPSVAKSVWNLFMILGKPNLTVTLGKYSSIVYSIVNNYCESISMPDRLDSDIGCFILVDRSVDYASTLLTPGTYTGLLDEVFNVKCGTVEIKVDADNLYQISLNDADNIYMQIKNRHFSDVFTYLKSEAEVLQNELKKSQHMNLQQMKQFVSKDLKNAVLLKKLLTYHIGACEAIISHIGQRFENLQNIEHCMLNCKNHRENLAYIENCIATDVGSKYDILRLISLMSLTNDGLTIDEMNSLKTQFLHKYGFNHLVSFSNLQNIGLVYEQQGIVKNSEAAAGILANKVVRALPSLPMKRSTFYNLAQKMKILPEITDNYDLKKPKDMSYVFGGAYIPLVCQLVSNLIKKEVSLEELEKTISNLCFHFDDNVSKDFNKQPAYFIYFIGGVTYAEIAAFQLLEKFTGASIYIAGTTIINGNLLMESVT